MAALVVCEERRAGNVYCSSKIRSDRVLVEQYESAEHAQDLRWTCVRMSTCLSQAMGNGYDGVRFAPEHAHRGRGGQ